MFRTFLSWRYLIARRTNLIGILGIFVGVFALILILSIMTGFLEESRRAVRGSLSDLIVQPDLQARGATREAAPYLRVIRSDPRVASASPQLVWGGMWSQEGGLTERVLSSQVFNTSIFVELVGIDTLVPARLARPSVLAHLATLGGAAWLPPIQDEFDTTELFHALISGRAADEEGRWAVENPFLPFLLPSWVPRRGLPRAPILVGEQLATRMGLVRGTELQIATIVPDPQTGGHVENNRKVVVAGTFRTGENETDLRRMYLRREDLADLLGGALSFSQILVTLHDYDRDAEATRDALVSDLSAEGLVPPGAAGLVRTWEQFRGPLLGAIENERVLMAIMLSLVLVVAGFTVFAILSMMVTEKRRDIGILCALGATQRGVMHVFLMIAFWDALLGAVLGGLCGIWAALKIDAVERWLSATFGFQIFNRDVYIFDYIPSIVEPLAVTAIVLGAFLCALLFAAVPAWRAARLHPLEALRYE